MLFVFSFYANHIKLPRGTIKEKGNYVEVQEDGPNLQKRYIKTIEARMDVLGSILKSNWMAHRDIVIHNKNSVFHSFIFVFDFLMHVKALTKQ